MSNLNTLIERAYEKRRMPLFDFIESEGLDTYELGYEDILYADWLNNAIVPCNEYMILVRERCTEDGSGTVAEYAIYKEHDRDGRPLLNSLNANAIYKLEFVGEETFDNMAHAIVYATNLIDTITDK